MALALAMAGGVQKPFRSEAERAYLMANNMRWHYVTPGHRSAEIWSCQDSHACKLQGPKSLVQPQFSGTDVGHALALEASILDSVETL